MRARYNTRPAKRVAFVRYSYGLADARMVGSELLDLACGAGILATNNCHVKAKGQLSMVQKEEPCVEGKV